TALRLVRRSRSGEGGAVPLLLLLLLRAVAGGGLLWRRTAWRTVPIDDHARYEEQGQQACRQGSSGLCVQVGQQLAQDADHLRRRFDFDPVGAEPRLVAPEFVLRGRRQIPFGAVGERHRERLRERARRL